MFKICRENKFSPINTGGVRLFYIIHHPQNHKKFGLTFFSLYFCTRKACQTPPNLHKIKPENAPISFRRHSDIIPKDHRPLKTRLYKDDDEHNSSVPLTTTDYKQGGGWFICIRFALTLLREVRLRLGRKNENFLIFILFFAHLALLCFAKLGCGSEEKMKIS